jgi:hypothetical protein
MNTQRETGPRFNISEASLIKVAIGLVLAVAFIASIPRCWPWYLWLLDVRIWTPWKCIGLSVALIECLVVIRLWPDKKRQSQGK